MKTELVIIADRSGSMAAIINETVEGLNNMIRDQKQEDGECRVTFARFDDCYEMVFENRDLQEIEGFSRKDILPRGMTALYDAIGKTTQSVGERLANTPEGDRPDRVIVLIMTDGLENDSHEYEASRIKEIIEHQTDKYSWIFTFLGANQNAILEGGKLGIAAANSITYGHNSAGTRSVIGTYSAKVKGLRSGGLQACNFSDDEREDALGK